MIMRGSGASPGALDTICWIRSRLDCHSVNSGEVDPDVSRCRRMPRGGRPFVFIPSGARRWPSGRPACPKIRPACPEINPRWYRDTCSTSFATRPSMPRPRLSSSPPRSPRVDPTPAPAPPPSAGHRTAPLRIPRRSGQGAGVPTGGPGNRPTPHAITRAAPGGAAQEDPATSGALHTSANHNVAT